MLPVLGLLLNVLAGAVVGGDMVLQRVLHQLGWPYWLTAALGVSSASLGVSLALLLGGRGRFARPQCRQVKWVVLRGVFGAGGWARALAAVQVGSLPGDVTALQSTNIVVGPLLGHALLNERLGPMHWAAVACSVLGSLLVTRPSFLPGGGDAVVGTDSMVWLGNLCAASSGVVLAGCNIASRKAADVSAWFHTLSAMVATVVICFVLSATPMAEEPAEALAASPLQACGWIAVMCAKALVEAGSFSGGAIFCPVAVSVTVYTATSMIAGFVVQTLIFGVALEATGVIGSAIMLVGVILMSLTHRPGSTSEPTQLESKTATRASKAGVALHADEIDAAVQAQGHVGIETPGILGGA